MRDGDRVLDIGCGDGFFARRFFAAHGARVDAIDIEPGAITHAERHNSAPQIRYFLKDAVGEPFPSDAYDVVVWDGALGHFSPDTTDRMLARSDRRWQTAARSSVRSRSASRVRIISSSSIHPRS